MKPALLVVDMQNEFFEPGSPALGSLTSAVEHINYALGYFRRAAAPVVVVSDIEEGRDPGTKRYETHESLKLLPADLRVDKRAGNAFWKTDLDAELRARDVSFVVVSGFCAEQCVLNTYRGAVERGYAAAILRGGIASPTAEHVRFVEAINDVVSLGALRGLLRLAYGEG
jgi:nicotinamidase-related amidase